MLQNQTVSSLEPHRTTKFNVGNETNQMLCLPPGFGFEAVNNIMKPVRNAPSITLGRNC